VYYSQSEEHEKLIGNILSRIGLGKKVLSEVIYRNLPPKIFPPGMGFLPVIYRYDFVTRDIHFGTFPFKEGRTGSCPCQLTVGNKVFDSKAGICIA